LATFFREEYQRFSSGEAKSNLAVNNLIGAHDHWSVTNSMVTEVAEGESLGIQRHPIASYRKIRMYG
jgi:hypothetical protein